MGVRAAESRLYVAAGNDLFSHRVVGRSMSRAGTVWDRATDGATGPSPVARSAMESFFSSLKTERTASKVYRTRDQARADVFDYIERSYNPRRRHSKLGYLSPMEFEARAMLA